MTDTVKKKEQFEKEFRILSAEGKNILIWILLCVSAVLVMLGLSYKSPLNIGLGFILFIISIEIFAWSWSLKKQVFQRTIELEKEIAEHKKTEEVLRKKNEQLAVLYEIVKRLNSFVSLEELLPWIVEQAITILGVDACVYRIMEADRLVRVGSIAKNGKEIMVKEKMKIGEGIAGLIAEEKRPLVISDDYDNDPRLIPEHREMARKHGFKAALGVPMYIEEKVEGILLALSKRPRKFTKEEIELLSAFANQAAIAVRNAECMQKLKEKNHGGKKNGHYGY
jgi:transcriptional regulator with GAF, ATPase, and Fis domain